MRTGNCAASRLCLLPSFVQFYSEFIQLSIQPKTQSFPWSWSLGVLSLAAFVSNTLPPISNPYIPDSDCVSQTQRGYLLCMGPLPALWSRNVCRKKAKSNCRAHLYFPSLGITLLCLWMMYENSFSYIVSSLIVVCDRNQFQCQLQFHSQKERSLLFLIKNKAKTHTHMVSSFWIRCAWSVMMAVLAKL